MAPIAASSPAWASDGDQFDPGQAAGGQRPQERQPARPVLGRGHVDAQDFAVALGVDPDGDQRVHVDHPPLLANLEDQGVGGHERVRAGVQWPGAKRLHGGVEFLGHHADLRLRQAGDAQRLDELVHPPRRHTQQVAGGHHGGQRPLGPLTAFQQPVRKVRTVPQLGYRQIQ